MDVEEADMEEVETVETICQLPQDQVEFFFSLPIKGIRWLFLLHFIKIQFMEKYIFLLHIN